MAAVEKPAAVPEGEKKTLVKPEKPNEEVYKANLKKAEKEHADAQAKENAIKAKLDIAKPTSKDSPSAKRRADLLAQLKEIRDKQSAGKSGRTKVFDQIKKEDAVLKEMLANQKKARGLVNFRTIEDLNREIERLDKQVESGTMKIVDEKKALQESNNLKKQRKSFAGFDEAEKAITAKKAQLKQLRDTLDDPESKSLSDKYNKIQGELDAIKAEQDDAYKNIKSLYDERNKLHEEQQAKYAAIRKLKDDFFNANRAVQKWEFEARQKARDRKKAEDEKYHQEKRKARAQQMLAEASDKAYLDEIRRAESLLRFLDPSYSAEKAPLLAPSQFQATAQRTVDDKGLKGMKVVKKEEEDYFTGTGGKKGKKNKKTAAAAAETPSAAKYSCPPSVMEDCAFMNIDPPMAASDIPAVREKVLEKLEFWKKDQAAQTERNIAKAKKEVERLEAEELGSAGPSTPAEPAHASGDGKATAVPGEGGSVKNEIALEEAADKDVADDLKEASLEDKE